MTLTSVIILLIIGLVLILVEIFVIPGSTFVGVVGIILIGIGVWGAFYYLEKPAGWIVFGGSIAIIGLLSYLGFRTKTWTWFEVKANVDGKAPVLSGSVQKGDTGITITPCYPIGKAKFGDRMEEVYSDGDYLEAGVAIKVIRLHEGKIIVAAIA